MPMDALCLSAVCREVEPAVLGGRIDKIYQPSRDEILLQIRGRAGSCRLLLSANPSRPRLQLTDLPRENPAEPPMFCMLLRKYLAGGKILALRQPPWSVWRSWLSRPPMRWGTKSAAVWCWKPWAAGPTCCCWTGRTGLWTACAGWRGT